LGGNQWAGARGITLFNTQSFKFVGKGLTVTSIAVEGVEMTHALSTGNNLGAVNQ